MLRFLTGALIQFMTLVDIPGVALLISTAALYVVSFFSLTTRRVDAVFDDIHTLPYTVMRIIKLNLFPVPVRYR